MWTRSLRCAALIVSAFGLCGGLAFGQDLTAKFDSAYRWGADQYQKELTQIEESYEAEIHAAQAKRAQAIKMARVRYLQGLKFLNGNPSLPQSLRVKVNEDMKRVSALPDPVAPELKPVSSAVPKGTAMRKIGVTTNTASSAC